MTLDRLATALAILGAFVAGAAVGLALVAGLHLATHDPVAPDWPAGVSRPWADGTYGWPARPTIECTATLAGTLEDTCHRDMAAP